MSKIEWTDITLNPGLYGCTAVSESCHFCYAASMALRLATMPQTRDRYEGAAVRIHGRAAWTGKVKVDFDQIGPAFAKLPKRLKKCGGCEGLGFVGQGRYPVDPCPDCGGRGTRHWRCFVTSMSDLFHEDVSFEFIEEVFAEMMNRPHINFQVLTKRPERMARWWNRWVEAGAGLSSWEWPGWPENVWAGTTVEDQQCAKERIPHLLKVPAPVRFLSMEPLLSRVDLSIGLWNTESYGPAGDERHIDWIIVGGESGHHARPSDADWFLDLRDQCQETGTAFFFKQMWQVRGVGKLSIPDDLMIREFPNV